MKSSLKKMSWKIIAIYVVYAIICLLIAAVVEEVNSFHTFIMIAIGLCINEFLKSRSRKKMESSITDLNVTQSFKIGNDSAIYYDETQEKIRLVSIGVNSCSSKDIDGVIVKEVMVGPTDLMDNSKSFFVISNEKDHSTILANTNYENFNLSKIENFETSIHVCGKVSSFFAVDQKNEKILAIQDAKNYRVASYEDIVKVELVEDGKSIKSKSSMRKLDGAAPDEPVAKGIVAFFEKLAPHKEVSEIKVKLLLRDTDNPEISILINTKKIDVNMENNTYKERLEEAQKIIDMVSVIIDQVDERSNVKPIV